MPKSYTDIWNRKASARGKTGRVPSAQNGKGGSREKLSMTGTMKRWLSLLLALVFVLSLGTVTVAEEEDPIGVTADDVYYNGALGIQMTLPDSWHFLTDEELTARMGYDSQYASREGLRQLLKRDSFVTVMFAESMDVYGTNVNLVVTDLGIYKSLDEKTFLSVSKSGLVEELQKQGYADVTVTEGTFQLAGQEHAGATVTCKVAALQMYMLVVLVKADKYMGSLTFASLDEQKDRDALAYFAPLTELPAAVAANPVHEQIADAIAKGDWDGALKLLNSKDGKSYPDYTAVRQNCLNHADYAEAKEAMHNKQYYTAYQLFTELGDFEDAAQKAKDCIQTTPQNKQLYRNPKYKKGTVKFNIANKLKGKSNAYLAFYDSTGTTKISTIFIRRGKDLTIYLPDDDYIIKAAYGTGPWFGEKEMFGDEGTYRMLYVQLTRTGSKKYWKGWLKNEDDGYIISRNDF